MCTAVSLLAGSHYFGRNLDLEYSLSERVVVTPRNSPLCFRRLPARSRHYAMIGIAHMADGYPLYYDAVNEAGLGMAALSFPAASYRPEVSGLDNVPPFELIPWLLGQCASVEQARSLLARLNLLALAFSPALPLTPLHWLLSDRHGSLTLEPSPDGLLIHEDPVGVLTNAPAFPVQMSHLLQFLPLSPGQPDNHLLPDLPLSPQSRGAGAVGLPGDFSSPSRFVRAAFTRAHSICPADGNACLHQFFHILDSVAQLRGCVRLDDGQLEFTRYSSCCNTDTGVYYYTTYENRQISAVALHDEDLEGRTPISYPLRGAGSVFFHQRA